jgi:hypothetical protein
MAWPGDNSVAGRPFSFRRNARSGATVVTGADGVLFLWVACCAKMDEIAYLFRRKGLIFHNLSLLHRTTEKI